MLLGFCVQHGLRESPILGRELVHVRKHGRFGLALAKIAVVGRTFLAERDELAGS